MGYFCIGFEWFFTVVPFCVAITTLVGCVQWDHFYGELTSSILLFFTTLRLTMLLWSVVYLRRHRGRLLGKCGVLKVVPWWLSLLTGYSGRVRDYTEGHDNEGYVYSVQGAVGGTESAQTPRDAAGETERLRSKRYSTLPPRSQSYASAHGADAETVTDIQTPTSQSSFVEDEPCVRVASIYTRNVVEGVLLLIVATQMWARYAGEAAAPPIWHDWEEVPGCGSADNCFELTDRLNETLTDVTKLYACSGIWLSGRGNAKREFVSSTPPDFFVQSRILMNIFPFPDDFVCTLQNTTLLHVYSKSRLGKSDFGVNKDRVNNYITSVLACAELL